MRLVLIGALVAFGLPGLSGCAPPRIGLRISPAADLDRRVRPPASFVIVPGDESTSEFDLIFREFAGYVAAALEERGFKEEIGQEDADFVVRMDYGVSDPIVRSFTYYTPTYTSFHYGRYRHHGHRGYGGGVGIGYSTYSRRTRYSTWFETMLNLEATLAGEEAPLWNVFVTVMTRSDDLRDLMPYLVVGSYHFWGVDSRRMLRQSIDVSDARVEALRDAAPDWARFRSKR